MVNESKKMTFSIEELAKAEAEGFLKGKAHCVNLRQEERDTYLTKKTNREAETLRLYEHHLNCLKQHYRDGTMRGNFNTAIRVFGVIGIFAIAIGIFLS